MSRNTVDTKDTFKLFYFVRKPLGFQESPLVRQYVLMYGKLAICNVYLEDNLDMARVVSRHFDLRLNYDAMLGEAPEVVTNAAKIGQLIFDSLGYTIDDFS